MTYLRNNAYWVRLDLVMQVAGPDVIGAKSTFVLPASTSDVQNPDPPPNATSPFGTGDNCLTPG
jgi:hypothetical protein